MTPSLKNIKYFVAVAQYKSFSLAADACFVSQSTLSAGIKRLEQELSACLVERNSKHVQLTTVGQEVLTQAQKLISVSDVLVEVARKDFYSSSLRFGVIPTIAPFLLPQMLNHWQQTYPNFSVFIDENTTDNLLLALRNYQLDCALIALPYGVNEFARYDLFDDSLSRIHHTNSRWITQQDNIKEGSLLLLSDVHCLRNHVLNRLKIPHSFVNTFHIQGLHTLAAMVAIDLGVSYMPHIAIEQGILDPYQKTIHYQKTLDVRTISLVYRYDAYCAEAMRKLVEPWARQA